MPLTRYDQYHGLVRSTMIQSQHGDYVRFEDFQRMTEEIATKIDEVWREKGGLNCTEVCAIVRAYGVR